MDFIFSFQTFFFSPSLLVHHEDLEYLECQYRFPPAKQNLFGSKLFKTHVFSADLSEKSTQILRLGVLSPFLLSDQVNLGHRQCQWDRANLQYPAHVQMCECHRGGKGAGLNTD